EFQWCCSTKVNEWTGRRCCSYIFFRNWQDNYTTPTNPHRTKSHRHRPVRRRCPHLQSGQAHRKEKGDQAGSDAGVVDTTRSGWEAVGRVQWGVGESSSWGIGNSEEWLCF